MTIARVRNSLLSLPLVLTVGCAHNPSLNILGSYFPGWIFCIFVASLFTVAVRFLLRRLQLEYQFAPLIIIYPSLAVFVCLALWLLLFGVR